VQIYLTINESP